MNDQGNLPALPDDCAQRRPDLPVLPALVRDAGAAARFAFEEFFYGHCSFRQNGWN